MSVVDPRKMRQFERKYVEARTAIVSAVAMDVRAMPACVHSESLESVLPSGDSMRWSVHLSMRSTDTRKIIEIMDGARPDRSVCVSSFVAMKVSFTSTMQQAPATRIATFAARMIECVVADACSIA